MCFLRMNLRLEMLHHTGVALAGGRCWARVTFCGSKCYTDLFLVYFDVTPHVTQAV